MQGKTISDIKHTMYKINSTFFAPRATAQERAHTYTQVKADWHLKLKEDVKVGT
jgi:hypothetical protein